jgi:hypothetical protein
MTNQQGAPEAPRGTAADGKTELFNVPGYPLMVRAVDFNRLHAENERLAALVEAQQPALSAARPVTPYTCPKCHALWLHWPAEQTGFGRDTLNCRSADHCHYCEKSGVEQLQRLERVPAALTAPQPSPTPQADSQPAPSAASKAVLAAIRAANMQLVRTGDDEFMLVTLKQATPQADSQPAMTPETVYAAIAHGDEEHRAWLLSALRAVWCGEAVPPVASPIANAAAESQPAPAGGAVAGSGWKWVPKILSDEMVDAWASARLPGGISQMTDNEANRAVAQANWDAMIAAAPTPPAQAADSVTAPAGGAVMEPTPVTDADVRDMSARVISGQAEEDELVAFFERLVPPRPVRITHEEDSVLEDAARLDWLDQQCEAYGFQDIHEGNRWEISGAYANVRDAIDAERAARKQGANHD